MCSLLAFAQTPGPAPLRILRSNSRRCWQAAATSTLRVPLFQSRVIRVNVPTTRMSVANPDVADIVVISPTELYVLGKDLGSTNVLIWAGTIA